MDLVRTFPCLIVARKVTKNAGLVREMVREVHCLATKTPYRKGRLHLGLGKLNNSARSLCRFQKESGRANKMKSIQDKTHKCTSGIVPTIVLSSTETEQVVQIAKLHLCVNKRRDRA